MASINVWRVTGSGGVRVKRNGELIGDMTPSESSKTFTFSIGDKFSFEAYPSDGWQFEKFCADPSCITQTTVNPFTGTIVADSGNMYVYFKKKPVTVNVSVTGSGTVKVYKNNALSGETKTSKGFEFFVGDTFKFEAVPDTDYAFDKYCTDAACTVKTTQNPFTGTIAGSGSITAYFVKPGVPATVAVTVSKGSGTVKAYKNNTPIGETKTSKVFDFVVGDTFKFEAVPDAGYIFEKYCTDEACTKTTAQNPFTGTIILEAGTLLARFGTPGTKGSISFSSEPAGADVFLDGRDQKAKTPTTITDVPTGTHTYSLKLSGYKLFNGSVKVEENKTVKVSAVLEKEGTGAGLIIGITLLGIGALGLIYMKRRQV